MLRTICAVVTLALQICISPARGQQFTALEVALGKQFFFDPRLSADGTVACATCHVPSKGLSDGLPRAVGILGQEGQFNTPTILTAPYQPLQFWNGRTTGVDEQSLQPLINPIEMGNDSVGQALSRIAGVRQYRAALQRIYGDPRLTPGRFARCIVAYEVSLNSFDAKVDRRESGYTRVLSPLAERGYHVFKRANCASCHTPPLYTDSAFHNTGISWCTGDEDRGRLDVLPPDSERTSETVRAWKTPTLRGIDRSAPYTHSGMVPTIETQIELYATAMARRNGRLDPFLDPRIIEIARLRLSAEDKRALARFLREGFSMPAAYAQSAPYRP